MMQDIKTRPRPYRSSVPNISECKKLCDLIYWEGPLLSLLIDPQNKRWLMDWVDNDETHNRWMVFHVSEDEINTYLRREITLFDLILKRGVVWFVDIDDNFDVSQPCCVSIYDIPESYWPSQDSFYDKSLIGRL